MRKSLLLISLAMALGFLSFSVVPGGVPVAHALSTPAPNTHSGVSRSTTHVKVIHPRGPKWDVLVSFPSLDIGGVRI